jgi:hypothetical protein
LLSSECAGLFLFKEFFFSGLLFSLDTGLFLLFSLFLKNSSFLGQASGFCFLLGGEGTSFFLLKQFFFVRLLFGFGSLLG